MRDSDHARVHEPRESQLQAGVAVDQRQWERGYCPVRRARDEAARAAYEAAVAAMVWEPGDVFVGFEFERPLDIPEGTEWVPYPDGGQGSYILVYEDSGSEKDDEHKDKPDDDDRKDDKKHKKHRKRRRKSKKEKMLTERRLRVDRYDPKGQCILPQWRQQCSERGQCCMTEFVIGELLEGFPQWRVKPFFGLKACSRSALCLIIRSGG